MGSDGEQPFSKRVMASVPVTLEGACARPLELHAQHCGGAALTYNSSRRLKRFEKGCGWPKFMFAGNSGGTMHVWQHALRTLGRSSAELIILVFGHSVFDEIMFYIS